MSLPIPYMNGQIRKVNNARAGILFRSKDTWAIAIGGQILISPVSDETRAKTLYNISQNFHSEEIKASQSLAVPDQRAPGDCGHWHDANNVTAVPASGLLEPRRSPEQPLTFPGFGSILPLLCVPVADILGGAKFGGDRRWVIPNR